MLLGGGSMSGDGGGESSVGVSWEKARVSVGLPTSPLPKNPTVGGLLTIW